MDAAFMSLQLNAAELELIMRFGLLPDALKPDFQCVRTHWNRGFMAFQLTRRSRTVLLMVPM
ncbi:MAG: hypothetical protein ACRDS0_38030 [Pseudonocardiaceae bacterium]